MSESPPRELPLRELQRWLQTVVEHPKTAAEALRCRAARERIAPRDVHRGRVLAPNARMAPAAQLQVYNGAYLARLCEVLEGDFGATLHVLGGDVFRRLAARYLQRFPSRHPNLNQLGRHLPSFVRAQRGLVHRAFVAELAELELACTVAFDAPEFEPLVPSALENVAPERWEGARFTTNPSLQLLAFRYPVDVFYQAWKDERSEPIPEPGRSFVAVFRKQDRVWRQRLTRPAHAVLTRLAEGLPLGDALAPAAAAGEPVMQWFQGFATDGLFTAVSFAD